MYFWRLFDIDCFLVTTAVLSHCKTNTKVVVGPVNKHVSVVLLYYSLVCISLAAPIVLSDEDEEEGHSE